MKFIFPKNYNFRNKIFGVIDYPTAILNIITFLIIYWLTGIVFKNFSFKIITIIIIYLPVLLFSVIGFNNENVLYILFYIMKYLLKPKLYLYY